MSGGNGLGRDHRDGQEHEQHTDGLDACHALAQYEDRKVDAGRWLEGGKNGGDIETTAMSSEHEQGIAQGIQDFCEHHQRRRMRLHTRSSEWPTLIHSPGKSETHQSPPMKRMHAGHRFRPNPIGSGALPFPTLLVRTS